MRFDRSILEIILNAEVGCYAEIYSLLRQCFMCKIHVKMLSPACPSISDISHNTEIN